MNEIKKCRINNAIKENQSDNELIEKDLDEISVARTVESLKSSPSQGNKTLSPEKDKIKYEFDSVYESIIELNKFSLCVGLLSQPFITAVSSSLVIAKFSPAT